MRVFAIRPDGNFSEYVQTPFQMEHRESIMEDWLESNPDGIVEDERILIIGRQVTTNLGGSIDLLGVDREGDVLVVELKRDRTPRDTIAQSLEYASFAERLDASQLEAILRSYLNDASLSLAEYHRDHFELGSDEAIAFNKDQHIVIVGQQIAEEIRQTAVFLRSKGVKVTCVEFAFFEAHDGNRLLSQEVVVGKESEKPTQVASGSLPVVTEEAFLASLDQNGKAVFSRIKEFAQRKSMPIIWGTKGFSLNLAIDGIPVAICFVYPPESVHKQSIRTTLYRIGGVEKKTRVPEEMIQSLRKQAEATQLFSPAGQDLRALINRTFSDSEVQALLDWFESVEKTVREHGLKEQYQKLEE